jgi:hypothetical protein
VKIISLLCSCLIITSCHYTGNRQQPDTNSVQSVVPQQTTTSQGYAPGRYNYLAPAKSKVIRREVLQPSVTSTYTQQSTVVGNSSVRKNRRALSHPGVLPRQNITSLE